MTLEAVPRQPPCKDIVDYYLTSILIYKLITISKLEDVGALCLILCLTRRATR